MLKCTLKFTVNQKCGSVSLDNSQPSFYVRVMCIFFLAAASQTTLVTTARDTETLIAMSTRPTVRTRTTSQLDLNIAVTHLKSYTSTYNRFIHLFVLQKWQWILVIQKKNLLFCVATSIQYCIYHCFVNYFSTKTLDKISSWSFRIYLNASMLSNWNQSRCKFFFLLERRKDVQILVMCK